MPWAKLSELQITNCTTYVNPWKYFMFTEKTSKSLKTKILKFKRWKLLSISIREMTLWRLSYKVNFMTRSSSILNVFNWQILHRKRWRWIHSCRRSELCSDMKRAASTQEWSGSISWEPHGRFMVTNSAI